MEVVLLGTGGADGWPNPFCGCRSCAAARASGTVRGQTAALVDDVLLLDCGPEAPRAAARAGRSLAGVSDLFLTHSHPDHTGPAALLWRSWAGRDDLLTVHGPAAALDECRPWIGPTDPVELHPMVAGETVDTGRYVVRALAAAHGDAGSGPGLLWDVTDTDGRRLLYATDTGPLPSATLGAVRAAQPYDLVLLEETFGERDDLGDDHLTLTTFAALLAELRHSGTVTSATEVVAVHLGHHNPPPKELDERLARWGARAGRDGERLVAGAGAGARVNPARVTLLLGGARSGKSHLAEQLVAADPEVVYVATGGTREGDAEWAERVDAHRARRPESWTTLETTDLVTALRTAPATATLLVDCLTLWLTDRMEQVGAWSPDPRAPDWSARLAREVAGLATAVLETRARVVLISNEVGQGVVPPSRSGRDFRDELGRVNLRLAEVADRVLLVTAGLPTVLKGARW